MHEKLKSFLNNDAVFYVILLILVAVASFGLGRKSALENTVFTSENQASLNISADNRQLVRKEEAPSGGQRVVASKSGTKYHLPTCPGASQIKEENKVFFDSPQLAEAAGYAPASNCQF